MTTDKQKEYSRRSYEKHREKVLERCRQRTAAGAARDAYHRKMAVPGNMERERERNRERMRRKREPQRLVREAAKLRRREVAEHARLEKLEARLNRPSAAELLKANKRRHHAKHCDAINARTHAWRIAHPDRFKAAVKKWREAHKEESRASVNKWVAAHPEQKRAMGRRSWMKRRALKANAFVEAVDPLVVYERDRGVCGICLTQIAAGQKWHIDHIEPLSKGGAHSYDNTQLAHAFCNVSKGAKVPCGQGLLLRRVG